MIKITADWITHWAELLVPPGILLSGLVFSLFLLPLMATEKEVLRASRFGSFAGLSLFAIYVVGMQRHSDNFSLEATSQGFNLIPILIGIAIGLAFARLVDWLRNGDGLAVLTFLATASTSIALYNYVLGNHKLLITYLSLGTVFGVTARNMKSQRSTASAFLLFVGIPVVFLIIVYCLQDSHPETDRTQTSVIEHSQKLRRFPATEGAPLSLNNTALAGTDLSVSENFRLLQGGEPISPPLRYADQEQPQSTTILSASNSGRHAFLVLCDQDWCDDWRLIDLKQKVAQGVFAGKYTRTNWANWSPGNKYAVLAGGEGELGLCIVDLNTRDVLIADYPKALSEIGSGKAELSTVRWLPNDEGFRFDFLLEEYHGGTSVYEALVDLSSGSMKCRSRNNLKITAKTTQKNDHSNERGEGELATRLESLKNKLAGEWHGSAFGSSNSTLTIRWKDENMEAILLQQNHREVLKIEILADDRVLLTGESVTNVDGSSASTYSLDTFDLVLNTTGDALKGSCHDERGTTGQALFRRDT